MDLEALLEHALSRSHRDNGRKQARSKRTQEQILNAAMRVFARDGLSRARIADVAADAGVPTSTLYEYYDSKESLAYEVPMSYLSTFYAEFAEAARGKKSPYELILLYLSITSDFARRNPEWGRLFYLEIWPSVLVTETDLSKSVDDLARVLIFLIREAISVGELPEGPDPYETASILLGGVNQVIITWLLYRRPRNLTKAGADITKRTLRMLKAETGSTKRKGPRAGNPPRETERISRQGSAPATS